MLPCLQHNKTLTNIASFVIACLHLPCDHGCCVAFCYENIFYFHLSNRRCRHEILTVWCPKDSERVHSCIHHSNLHYSRITNEITIISLLHEKQLNAEWSGEWNWLADWYTWLDVAMRFQNCYNNAYRFLLCTVLTKYYIRSICVPLKQFEMTFINQRKFSANYSQRKY